MTTAEKVAEDFLQLIAPLETDALLALYDIAKALITHDNGAALKAKRQAQALEAEAEIRS